MGKWFWAVLVAVVVGLVAVFALTNNGSENGTSTNFSSVYADNPLEVKEPDHKRGAGNKSVTFVEYGDFQCPGCGYLYPILKQAKDTYGDDIAIVFRHFPLINIHPNAMAAHRAAEAASKQGKFWEMHDLLYERQFMWSQGQNVHSTFEQYAQELELDVEQYKQDVAAQETADLISAQMESGRKLGATGTPTLYLNGELVEDPTQKTFEDYQKLIDDAIAKHAAPAQ